MKTLTAIAAWAALVLTAANAWYDWQLARLLDRFSGATADVVVRHDREIKQLQSEKRNP